jgi:hypothetical protein
MFSTEQRFKHHCFELNKHPNRLVLVFAAVCQTIFSRANLLEIQGYSLLDRSKQLRTKLFELASAAEENAALFLSFQES